MKCFGITKSLRRCKNNASFIYCDKHRFQPYFIIISVVSIVGFWGGFYQDLIKPIGDSIEKYQSDREPVDVKIESNRFDKPSWDKTSTKVRLSDVITVRKNNQVKAMYEFYHMAKNNKFTDYPPTSKLTNEAVSTEARVEIVDLDNDGRKEIIIWLENKIYSLHGDQMVNFIVLDSNGDIKLTSPLPSKIDGIKIVNDNPYSAYGVDAILYDEISKKSWPITYTNSAEIKEVNGEKVLLFRWTLDDNCYACDHVSQVDTYKYSKGNLTKFNKEPLFDYGENCPKENGQFGYSTDVKTAINFITKNKLPSFNKLMEELEDIPLPPHKKKL